MSPNHHMKESSNANHGVAYVENEDALTVAVGHTLVQPPETIS